MIRPMIEIDLPEVVGDRAAQLRVPLERDIFRDCLRVGYTCRVAGSRRPGHRLWRHESSARARRTSSTLRRATNSAVVGFGRRLLEHLLERAAAAGIGEAFLEVRPSNLAAIRLYQRLGFEQIGIRRGYYQAADGREDAIVLKAATSGRTQLRAPSRSHDFDRAGDGAAAHVRDHFASRRRQDHADREAAAVRRRDPDGRHGEGAQGRAPCDVRLDGAREGARHLGDLVGHAVSVSATRIVNLLDTPGHEDFSEDTYRMLTAVDSALMVIDCAKGVEERTIKLMEVCRLRDTPIMTFINKLDREGRAPIELLDEVESRAEDPSARR